MPQCAMLVQLGLVKVTKDKHPVPSAAPANSIMSLVLLPVNRVMKIPFSARKEEMQRALDVPLVGLLRLVVQNVNLVQQVRMAKAVKVVQQVITAKRQGRPFVWDAQQDITRRGRVNRFAWGATPVNLLHITRQPSVSNAKKERLKMEKDPMVPVKFVHPVFNQTKKEV